MKNYLLYLLLCLSILGKSQQKVESNTYAVMLKGLLSHSVPELAVDSAILMDSNTVWLDAREPHEIKISSLRNSLAVGYDNFHLGSVKHLSKDQTIVVYCSVGYRSEKVAEQLLKSGFTKVFNLYGGIFEWVNQGHAVYVNDQPTSNVHAYNKVWGTWLNKGNKVYDK